MRPRNVRTGDDGFTLLEILVALMILASATIVFSKTISSSVLQMSGATRLQSAMLLGEKLMVQTQASFTDAEMFGKDSDSGLEWRVQTQPVYSVQPPQQDALKLVTIDIFKAGTIAPIYQLRTVLIPQVRP